MLPRPNVGALGAHDEGKVSEHCHRSGIPARASPLLIRDPLQPRAISNLPLETATGLCQRIRTTVANAFFPLEPIAPAVGLTERTEQGVVFQPPGFTFDEFLKLPCTW